MNAYKVLFHAINDKKKKILLSIIIIVSIIFTTATLVFPLLVKDIIDKFSVDKVNLWIIGGLVLFLIIKSLIEAVHQYIISIFGNMVIRDLQKNIYNKIIHYKVEFFDDHHSGELSSRIVNDTEIIKNLLTYSIPKLVTGIITIFGGITLIIILDWKLTIVILLISPFIFGIIFPLMRKMEKTGHSQQEEISVFISKTQETFKDIKMVKASTAEKHEKSVLHKCIDRLYNANLYESKVFSLVAPLVNFLLILGLLIVVGYGAYRISVGTLSISTLVAFVIYAFQMMTPMSTISGFIGEYHKANGAIKSLNNIINNNDIEQSGKNNYEFQNELSVLSIFLCK